MQSKQDGLVPIGEALADLGGPIQAIRDASPQALHHYTRWVYLPLNMPALSEHTFLQQSGRYPRQVPAEDVRDAMERWRAKRRRRVPTSWHSSPNSYTGYRSPSANIVVWETQEAKAANNTQASAVACKAENVDFQYAF